MNYEKEMYKHYLNKWHEGTLSLTAEEITQFSHGSSAHDVRYEGTDEHDTHDIFRCHTCYPTVWDKLRGIFTKVFTPKQSDNQEV